jgi:hypothetical protein
MSGCVAAGNERYVASTSTSDADCAFTKVAFDDSVAVPCAAGAGLLEDELHATAPPRIARDITFALRFLIENFSRKKGTQRPRESGAAPGALASTTALALVAAAYWP